MSDLRLLRHRCPLLGTEPRARDSRHELQVLDTGLQSPGERAGCDELGEIGKYIAALGSQFHPHSGNL